MADVTRREAHQRLVVADTRDPLTLCQMDIFGLLVRPINVKETEWLYISPVGYYYYISTLFVRCYSFSISYK